jgi:UDP-2-acetamido-2,6-beta-L-arabino-hexul-4-ose reductase
MRILVTGSNGFIGKNLITHLNEKKNISVLHFERGDSLTAVIAHVDFIFHLAGENRTKDLKEFEKNNAFFTKSLCKLIKDSNRHIPIVFASSIQAELDNPYGKSKLSAEVSLEKLAKETGNPVHIYRLPNVFGKWCKPNYNSVVSTFCNNILNDFPIRIDDESLILKLIHIDYLIADFLKVFSSDFKGFLKVDIKPQYEVSLGKLASLLYSFKEGRDNLIIKDVGVGLIRDLYSTYISFLTPDLFVYDLPSYKDERGVFVEMLKTSHSGQFSYFTAHPGITRGGHFHHTKTEKFLVIKGKARFKFKNIISKDSYELISSGVKPQVVETAPGWSHDITNIGDDEMIVMLWANEIYNHDFPDTITHEV